MHQRLQEAGRAYRTACQALADHLDACGGCGGQHCDEVGALHAATLREAVHAAQVLLACLPDQQAAGCAGKPAQS